MKIFAFLVLSIAFTGNACAQPYTVCDESTTKLCDTKGGEINFEQYTHFAWFDDTHARCYDKNEHCGLLDLQTGKEILPCQYQYIYPCTQQQDVVLLKQKDEAFFYSLQSRAEISPRFNDVMPDGFSYIPIDGSVVYLEPGQPFLCRMGGKCGAITSTGKIMIPFEYDDLRNYYQVPDDFMIAGRKGEYLVLTREGKPLNEKRYTGMTGFWDEGHIMAWRNNTLVFIDRAGSEMPGFETGKRTAAFAKNGKFAFFSITGRQITPYAYTPMYAYGPYAYVSDGRSWGVVDTMGSEIIPLKYTGIDFHPGSKDMRFELHNEAGKYGMADSRGNIIAPLVYDYIVFDELYSLITKGEKEGYLKHDGTELLPCIYDDAQFFGEGNMAGVSLNGKWGFINEKGEAIIPFKYDKIDYFRQGRARVELNGKVGSIDLRGHETWD